MSENIKLEVVTPEKSVVSELAKIVMAPGTSGEFGVLSGHTPFLTTLKNGAIRFTSDKGQEKFVFVSNGFAETLPNKVTILAESSERRKDIDVKRAKLARDRAIERLSYEKNKSTENNDKKIDFKRARAALFRAIQRIKLAKTIV